MSRANAPRRAAAAFRLKVGVEGRVLLGPAGSPGSYGATLARQVLRGTTVVGPPQRASAARLPAARAVSISACRAGHRGPARRGDVEIIVGLWRAGGRSGRPSAGRR
jgi:hypothetical protein